jgi:predicted dehydrogenase
VRVAIAGYGLAGRVIHAPLIRAATDAQIVAVVTRDAQRRQQAIDDNPGVRCYDTVQELIAEAEVELVVIASPTATHVSVGMACIQAKLPIVVDKPIAVDAAQARRLVAAAERASVPLTVFQNRRWDSDQLTLRRLINDGALGRIFRYESRIERWRPDLSPGKWREERSTTEGGGVLLDLGCHLVDQALQLFGPARSVFAEVEHQRGALSDDDVFIALEHDGVHAHLWCSSMAGSPGPRLRVLGTTGAFVVQDADQQENGLRAGQPPAAAQTPPGAIIAGDTTTPVPPVPGRWSDFYPQLFQSLHSGATLPVDPHDAVRTQVVLDAAQLSARQRSVIRL